MEMPFNKTSRLLKWKSLFVTLITFGLLGSPALAADQTLVDLIARAYTAPPYTFLLQEFGGPYFNRQLRIVFIYRGNRYTVDLYPMNNRRAPMGVNVWVRPNSTGGIRSLKGLADIDMDRRVDFGTQGSTRHFARAGLSVDGFPVQGPQYEAYWQRIYDEAIIGLEATFNRHHN